MPSFDAWLPAYVVALDGMLPTEHLLCSATSMLRLSLVCDVVAVML